MRENLYIPSIDAKDLYLSNNYINTIPYGYKLTRKDGTNNYSKYMLCHRSNFRKTLQKHR